MKSVPSNINLDPAPPIEETQSTSETGTSLVNESPDKPQRPERPVSPILAARKEAATLSLDEQLLREKANNEKLRQRIELAEAKVSRNHSSPESIRLRIFLELLSGFAQKGAFDQTVLAGQRNNSNPQPEKTVMKHAANLAEVAYAEIESHVLYGLKYPKGRLWK